MNTIILTIILITSTPTSYSPDTPTVWKRFTVTQVIDGWESMEQCTKHISAHRFDEYLADKNTMIRMYPEHAIEAKNVDVTMYCSE